MEKRTEYARWKWLLYLGIVAVFVWFVLKYLLGLFLPLAIAFIFTRIVYPGAVRLRRLCKKWHIPLSARLSRLLVFFTYLSLVIIFLFWILWKGWQQLKNLMENIGVYRLWIENFFQGCCLNCDRIFGFAQGETFERLKNIVGNSGGFLQEKITSIPVSAVSFLGMFGSVGFILLFSVLLTMMALSNLERWYRFYRHCGFYKECHEILRELTGAGYAYLRTQIIVVFFVALLCVFGLALMGNPYPLLIGIGIAVVDAFPVLGSGMIFFPWIVISAFMGNFKDIVLLVLLYAGCQFLRQMLEPKLMGKKLHMEPALMLVSIFVGLKLFSAAGVLLGPAGFLLIRSVMKLLAANGVFIVPYLYREHGNY